MINNFRYGFSIDQDLIDHLEEIFPDKIPSNPNITISEINNLQGKRSVIEYIKSLKKEIEEDSVHVHVNAKA